MRIFTAKPRHAKWSIAILASLYLGCSTQEEIGVAELSLVGVEQSPAFLQVGASILLSATLVPEDATNQTLIWRSSNETAALVNQQGVVFGAGDGEATITVESQEDPTLSDSADFLVNDARFKTVWDEPDDRTIIIPTNPEFAGQYNYDIDFNDDGVPDVRGQRGDFKQTLTFPGPYTISISGDFPGIQLGITEGLTTTQVEDRQKMANTIRSVEQWGTIEWRSMNKAFESCVNLIVNAEDVPDLSRVEDLSSMFKNAESADPDVSRWDVSQVVDMSSMFEGAIRVNPDMRQWEIRRRFLNMEKMLDTSGISAVNYANALLNFVDRAEEQGINTVTLGASGVEFCDFAQDARTALQNSRNWTFTDAGSVQCD